MEQSTASADPVNQNRTDRDRAQDSIAAATHTERGHESPAASLSAQVHAAVLQNATNCYNFQNEAEEVGEEDHESDWGKGLAVEQKVAIELLVQGRSDRVAAAGWACTG